MFIFVCFFNFDALIITLCASGLITLRAVASLDVMEKSYGSSGSLWLIDIHRKKQWFG